jgi:hypothetical protein
MHEEFVCSLWTYMTAFFYLGQFTYVNVLILSDHKNNGCVSSHTVALPFTLKKYLKAKKEELWRLKYFTMQKYIILKKSSKKKTKILKKIIL